MAIISVSIIGLISDIRDASHHLIVTDLVKRGVTDIVTSHGNILAQLYHRGHLQMSELASLIGRKKNTVTNLVGKLKDAGYVRLGKSTSDRGIIMVELI